MGQIFNTDGLRLVLKPQPFKGDAAFSWLKSIPWRQWLTADLSKSNTIYSSCIYFTLKLSIMVVLGESDLMRTDSECLPFTECALGTRFMLTTKCVLSTCQWILEGMSVCVYQVRVAVHTTPRILYSFDHSCCWSGYEWLATVSIDFPVLL